MVEEAASGEAAISAAAAGASDFGGGIAVAGAVAASPLFGEMSL